MNSVIEVNNLVKKYGTNTVIDNISFNVNKGEIFALLGANGAGKTTTLECIEKLRSYNDGTIKVNGSIGVQLQSSSLPENITVIVSPGSYVGPVTFTQLCQISDINCAISTLVDAGIKKSLTDIAQGGYTKKVSAGAIFGLTPNAIISNNSLDITLKNNVYQLISSSCIFETNQVLSNNYVYVGSGATTGAISFAQSSTITSTDCAIDIIAKNNTYQVDDTTKSTPILVLAIILIVVIIFIAIVFVIVILIGKANRKSKNRYAQLNNKIYDRVENYRQSTYPIESLAHR